MPRLLLFPLAVLVFGFVQEPSETPETEQQEPREGAGFFEAFCGRMKETKAFSIRFSAQAGGQDETIRGCIQVRGDREVRLELKVRDGERAQEKISMISDGGAWRLEGKIPGFGRNLKEWKPEDLISRLRNGLDGPVLNSFFLLGEGVALERTGEVRDLGEESIDGRKMRKIQFGVKPVPLDENGGRGFPGEVDSWEVTGWFDPVKKRPVRWKYAFLGMTPIVEEIEEFELDVEFAGDEFALHSLRTLREGRTAQVTSAVRLFTEFTGMPPRTLGDLVSRPDWLEADIFWPTGGFWLGTPPSEKIEYRLEGMTPVVAGEPLPAANRSAVTAPTGRLARHLTARVQIRLIHDALAAFHVTYSRFPGRKTELSERPEWALVWPEGGWLPGGVPKDPEGCPYRIISHRDWVRVQLQRGENRGISLRELTSEERAGFEAGARVRLSGESRKKIDRLVGQLGADDLFEREDAQEALMSMGPAVRQIVEERLETEEDPEVTVRLRAVRSRFPEIKPIWRREMGRTIMVAGSSPEGMGLESDFRNAAGTLKSIATAQVDFRQNDRDGDTINNFWVDDVRGLYAMKLGDHSMRLIERSVAGADGAPDNRNYADRDGWGPDQVDGPKAGYRFRMLTHYDSVGAGMRQSYDSDGTGRNRSRFGVIAYPEDFEIMGGRVAVISESNTVYWKEMEGAELPDTFPADPLAEGWKPLD